MSYFPDNFLIALPTMGDPRFSQTVTYLCEHNTQGALGIIINRPLEITLGEVMEHMQIPCEIEALSEQMVFMGGPVETQRGFVLHEPGGDWESALEVNTKLQVTTSKDILEAIAIGNGPDEFLVALGYAGWGAGQLEEEMVGNSWINTEADHAIVFRTPVKDRWQSAADLLGVDLKRMSATTGHA